MLEEMEVERGGPGYSIPKLVEKLGKALQGTSNASAPGPDKISYQFIKAVIGTIFGEELLVQMAKELEKGRAPPDWQLSKVVMIPKPGKDHTQLKGVTARGHPGWHEGLLSGWLPALRSRSLVLVSGIHKGSAALALHFPLLRKVLFFRP